MRSGKDKDERRICLRIGVKKKKRTNQSRRENRRKERGVLADICVGRSL